MSKDDYDPSDHYYKYPLKIKQRFFTAPSPSSEVLTIAVKEVEAECREAARRYSPFKSPHEGYAVLLEEVDELWDEVRMKGHDRDAMRKEAMQVAAMALRFMVDLT